MGEKRKLFDQGWEKRGENVKSIKCVRGFKIYYPTFEPILKWPLWRVRFIRNPSGRWEINGSREYKLLL